MKVDTNWGTLIPEFRHCIIVLMPGAGEGLVVKIVAKQLVLTTRSTILRFQFRVNRFDASQKEYIRRGKPT